MQRKREQRSSQDPRLSKLPSDTCGHISTNTDRFTDCVSACVRLQPTPLPSEDVMLLTQEEPGLTVEKPGPPTDEVTPLPVPALPSPPSATKKRERPSLELEVPASRERICIA